jgi:hypothetical protein
MSGCLPGLRAIQLYWSGTGMNAWHCRIDGTTMRARDTSNRQRLVANGRDRSTRKEMAGPKEPAAALASNRAGATRHSKSGKSLSTGTGTETTLGLPQAVEIRIVRDKNFLVVVNRLRTTATTRPSQSSTGAPEAP